MAPDKEITSVSAARAKYRGFFTGGNRRFFGGGKNYVCAGYLICTVTRKLSDGTIYRNFPAYRDTGEDLEYIGSARTLTEARQICRDRRNAP